MDINYYITFDLPVPYKKLKIYPVTVKDYLLFGLYSQSLTFNKNIIPDIEIISMTNLEYIFYATEKELEKTPYLLWYDRLLSLCLKEEKSFEIIEESIKRYGYDKNKKPFIKINNEIYFSEDYEEIKKIISQQNMLELPDETMSEEVRESLEKALEYKNKIYGTKAGSFEDYIVSLSIATGWTFEQIYNMPIRKFTKSIKRIDNLIHYKIYLAASMSGMVEFKDKSFIKHWLLDLDNEDKYENVSVDIEEVQNKVSLESAKK